jgi:hypothetical protein
MMIAHPWIGVEPGAFKKSNVHRSFGMMDQRIMFEGLSAAGRT